MLGTHAESTISGVDDGRTQAGREGMAAVRSKLAEAGLCAAAWAKALNHLADLVEARHPPAMRCLGALFWVWAHHAEEDWADTLDEIGARLVLKAASNGDRLAGMLSAKTTVDRTAERERSQHLLREAIAIFGAIPPWEAPFGSAAPLTDRMRLVHISGQISPAERFYLIAKANGRMSRSQVKSKHSDLAHENEGRSSIDVGFPRQAHDAVLYWTVSRLSVVADRAWSCAEPLNVIRYGPGEKFVPHFDADHTNSRQAAQTGGLRRTTALGYLNDGYLGGETAFPRLNAKLSVRAGDVILFDNLDMDGKTEGASLHAGLPLIDGEKWILAQWFRQTPFERLDDDRPR